ncbi:MAG: M48 family metallopeptidase [Thermoproteota archaeon]|nr:M48 family metallopeptidase [Thermoproteota archaeon]
MKFITENINKANGHPRHIENQIHRIVYKNNEIKFRIIKTSKRKTTEIIIRYGDILVRAPVSKPAAEIKELVEKKSGWILKHLDKIKYNKPEVILPKYKNNTTLPYLGKNYDLTIIKDVHDYVEFANNTFSIYSRRPESRLWNKETYEKWLFSLAPRIFHPLVEKYSSMLNAKPGKILIKDLKSRWGSTTPKDTINLNVHLMKAPLEVIEYVVLHEIGHLRVKDHSHRFWELIKNHMNDYDIKRKWLKINGHNILI